MALLRRAISSIKAENFDPLDSISSFQTAGNGSLADQSLELSLICLEAGATLTGMVVPTAANGNFTGNNNNKVGLYTSNGTTLTKVAESANNANIWKGGTNAAQLIPFTTPYVAAAGRLYGAYLYCRSAQTTAPSVPIRSGTVGGSTPGALYNLMLGRTGHFRAGTLAAQTDLPSSILVSAIVNSGTIPYMGVY